MRGLGSTTKTRQFTFHMSKMVTKCMLNRWSPIRLLITHF